jgi:hypothetical protein
MKWHAPTYHWILDQRCRFKARRDTYHQISTVTRDPTTQIKLSHALISTVHQKLTATGSSPTFLSEHDGVVRSMAVARRGPRRRGRGWPSIAAEVLPGSPSESPSKHSLRVGRGSDIKALSLSAR